jgi:hypothetical protein
MLGGDRKGKTKYIVRVWKKNAHFNLIQIRRGIITQKLKIETLIRYFKDCHNNNILQSNKQEIILKTMKKADLDITL